MLSIFIDVPPVPGQPRIQNLKDTSAVLEWDISTSSNTVSNSETPPIRKYKLEACRLRSSESWSPINAEVQTTKGNGHDDGHAFCTVNNLRQGETYTFRVTAVVASTGSNGQSSDISSKPSLPSNPLTIPLGDIPSATVGTTVQGALSSRRSSSSSGSGSCSGGGMSSQVRYHKILPTCNSTFML